MSLSYYGEVLCFFTLRPSDLMVTLTYVLMYNFCPCFFKFYLLMLALVCACAIPFCQYNLHK